MPWQDGVFVAQVLVPDLKLLLLKVLLSAVAALPDALVVDCIPAGLSDCCTELVVRVLLVVGTKVGKEVMDNEERAGDVMYLENESVNYQQLSSMLVYNHCIGQIGYGEVLQVQQLGLAVH